MKYEDWDSTSTVVHICQNSRLGLWYGIHYVQWRYTNREGLTEPPKEIHQTWLKTFPEKLIPCKCERCTELEELNKGLTSDDV